MKARSVGLGLVLVASSLAVLPVEAVTAAPPPTGLERLRDDADGRVSVSREPATGRVDFVRATGDLFPGRGAATRSAATGKADAFLDRHAGVFGARPGELVRADVRPSAGGWTVAYEQRYRGIPVFGGDLRAHIDEDGDLTSVNGFAVPVGDLGTTPRLSEEEAAAKAVALVKAEPKGHDRALEPKVASGLKTKSTDLMVYRLGSTRGVDGEPVLAWVIEVTNERDVRETVILDASTGKPVNRWSMIAHALDRELYEAYLDDNGTPDDESDDTVGGLDTPIWKEGDLFPDDLDEDQQNEVLGTGETYWFFRNSFGRDSFDGAGATMKTVNNDPRIQCPNANWNGVTTNYCSGVTSDDTVAHEWAHAYTEYTSDLVYQWQSGAMNEAYSDIWGETVDMLNDRMDTVAEDEPRVEGDCSSLSPARISVEITAPAEVAGPCQAVPASGGPQFTTDVLTPQVVVGLDDNTSGSTTDGCSAFTNAAAIGGKWVYVDENFGPNGCSYSSQGQRAEDAGALGIIVGSTPPYAPFDMPGATFDIPALQVDPGSAARFKTAGTSTVRITATTTPDDPSERWLSGENDPAFGGAIRDMWNPTCYGHPGKVSDEEYHCETSDSGGVHINSGVVNHTFAMLVDGATYNGVTVPAIGLDKAAHLFWRAQTEYLTMTSDFADLAASLTSSCTDLTGDTDLNQLAVGVSDTGGAEVAPTPLDEPITTDDCAAVQAATQATELTETPTQCAFGELLDKATPALCGAGFTTTATWSEDFEDGLAGWTQDEEVVFDGADGLEWEADTTAPDSRAGGVAFAPDPPRRAPGDGNCEGDAGDISSRNGLISPTIVVPSGPNAKLSFDHYVATEVGYDGGNVKVRFGGGAFTAVPTAAYSFNAPGAALETTENTNPMAGETAFTGTDQEDNGNPTGGSWGTSVLDLTKVPGATAGAPMQIRFDFGRDGCNGVDGWYIDNVRVTTCAPVVVPPVPSTTSAKAAKKKVSAGKKAKAEVRVTAAGTVPQGTVRVTNGRKTYGTGTLNAQGKVTIKLDKVKKPGKVKFTASYLGSATVQPSSDKFTVKFVKRRRR